jgi:carboxypeptidase Q
MIKDFSELEKKKNEIRGKIVFFNYPFNKNFVRTFVAYGDAVAYRATGASRAAKYGAVGVLIRSMTESTDNIPHTGAMVYIDSLPKIPALAVGLQDADKLASSNQKDIQIYISTEAHTLPDTVGYNVIGEWSGSEFPDEYITIGAHLDSWDPAEGAQDDGAGCVQTIEILRALKATGYKPRHTLRFVLFTDEENGDRGAEKYLADAKARNEKHIMALESDAGGFTPRAFSFRATESQFDKLRSWLPFFMPYGISEITNEGAGTDVEPLNESLGIPAGQLVPDSQRYFDYHHAASDVFEIVNKRELELGTINMTALIYLTDKYGL